jgi:hypothetical protein
MSNLLAELLLRLIKPLVAAILGAVLYWIVTGPLGEAGSIALALLCWIAAAALVLLMETGLI